MALSSLTPSSQFALAPDFIAPSTNFFNETASIVLKLAAPSVGDSQLLAHKNPEGGICRLAPGTVPKGGNQPLYSPSSAVVVLHLQLALVMGGGPALGNLLGSLVKASKVGMQVTKQLTSFCFAKVTDFAARGEMGRSCLFEVLLAAAFKNADAASKAGDVGAFAAAGNLILVLVGHAVVVEKSLHPTMAEDKLWLLIYKALKSSVSQAHFWPLCSKVVRARGGAV